MKLGLGLGFSQSRGGLFLPSRTGKLLLLDTTIAGSVILNGSNVSQWTDQSGNGYHLTQATGANQPLYVASVAGLNNKPGITATGAQVLANAALSLPAPHTIYAVASPGSNAAYRVLFGPKTNAPAVSEVYGVITTGTNLIAQNGYAQAGTQLFAGPHAWCGVFSTTGNGNSMLFQDTFTTPDVSHAPSAGYTLMDFGVGNDYTGGDALAGPMSFLYALSGIDTLAQRKAMMQYLSAAFSTPTPT